MEKEKSTMIPADHAKMCGWCGMDRGMFSWTRLALAVMIGLFIFLAGIQIGEMRAQYGNYGTSHMMVMHSHWTGGNQMMDDQTMPQDGTMIAPATNTPVVAPAVTTPAPKK